MAHTIPVSLAAEPVDNLEDRIAHIESALAANGTRKLSLKISGWISTGIMAWRDGAETGVYVVDNSELNSRFCFVGQAGLSRHIRAGFRLEFGLSGNFPGAEGAPSSNCTDQISSQCGELVPNIRNEQVWLEHDHLGRLTIGYGDPPSRLVKNWAGRVAGSQFWGMDSSPQVGMSMRLRNRDGFVGNLRWRHIINGRVGPFRERVEWRSADLAGFQLYAGAGTDDHWDLALYYANRNLAGLKIFAALAYLNDRTPETGLEFSEWKGSFGALHLDTGLYAWFATANRDYYNIKNVAQSGGMDWYIQTGIKRKIFSPTVGETALSIDFGEHTRIRNGLPLPGIDAVAADSKAHFIGIGATHWLPGEATELYAGWRRYTADPIVTTDGNRLSFDDLDVIVSGVRVKF